MKHGNFEQHGDLTLNIENNQSKCEIKNSIPTTQLPSPHPHVLGDNESGDEDNERRRHVIGPVQHWQRNLNVPLRMVDDMTSKNDDAPESVSSEENDPTEDTDEFLVTTLSQAKHCAEVSEILTFRKYWSFNHSVYFADLRIKNTSTGWIAYKVTPSNCDKLCIRGYEFQGVIGPQQTRVITIVTNSTIPYKYVDIVDENVEVIVVPVEFEKPEHISSLHFSSSRIWRYVTKGQLDEFWGLHLPEEFDIMTVYRIDKFSPYDLIYLKEVSVIMTWDVKKTWIWKCLMGIYKLKPWVGISHFLVTEYNAQRRKIQNVAFTFVYYQIGDQKTKNTTNQKQYCWRDTGVVKYLKSVSNLKPWKKFSHTIIDQFDKNRQIVRSIVAVMVPSHVRDLDTTQNLATAKYEFSRLRRKQKIIKFIISGFYLYFLLSVASFIPNFFAKYFII